MLAHRAFTAFQRSIPVNCTPRSRGAVPLRCHLILRAVSCATPHARSVVPLKKKKGAAYPAPRRSRGACGMHCEHHPAPWHYLHIYHACCISSACLQLTLLFIDGFPPSYTGAFHTYITATSISEKKKVHTVHGTFTHEHCHHAPSVHSSLHLHTCTLNASFFKRGRACGAIQTHCLSAGARYILHCLHWHRLPASPRPLPSLPPATSLSPFHPLLPPFHIRARQDKCGRRFDVATLLLNLWNGRRTR